MRRRRNTWMGSLLLLTAAFGCSGSDPVDVGPDPEVAPFVGTWDAEVFTVTSDADSSVVANLLLNSGSFTINVQESGTYTATLTFGGMPLVEIGTIVVDGGFLTLVPGGGDPATSAFSFPRSDYMTLDGPTEFDFNLDSLLDPAQARIELQRR